ncbi:type IV secretory system conjugative DNA transfer family protein [Actinomyces naeslundii]|uniref:type IV secretory system conjugative DNA transfer family protein n=1 Tax=Actinomyces naeslundii TaxID=1655 RepID=UPI000A74DEB6|nr:TraM recognition domain-containing protein [Actinomyces naeslundii]
MSRSSGTDSMMNFGLFVSVGGAAVAASARLAAGVACTASGCSVSRDPVSGTIASVLLVAPARAWGAQGMSGIVFWLCWVVMLVPVVAGAVWVWRQASARGLLGGSGRSGDLRHEKGMATRAQAVEYFGARQLEKMVWLRPDLARPTCWELGYRVGRCRGVNAFLPKEDSLVVEGPSRSSKSRLVLEAVLAEFTGAVVGTSVRAEMAARTVLHRQALGGPVAVFAPGGVSTTGEAGRVLQQAQLRWSLTRGCENSRVALRRAKALAANAGKGTGGSAAFWESHARQVLAPLLHAAALSGEGVDALARWTQSPARARDAVAVLNASSAAERGWADRLDGELSGDSRTVDNIWATVSSCVGEPLMDSEVREMVSPAPGMELDIESFIRQRGTLYVVSDNNDSAAPFLAALIEDFYAVATELANRSEGNRLCPGLLLCLDEIANIAVLPSLPKMMSAGGGSNITVIISIQARAQLAARFGRDAAQAIWAAATARMLLGGTMDGETQRDVVASIGERTVERRTGSTGLGQSSWGDVRENVATAGQVRALAKASALLFKGAAPAAVIDLMDIDTRLKHRGRRYPSPTSAAAKPPDPAVAAEPYRPPELAPTSYGQWPAGSGQQTPPTTTPVGR